MKWFKTGKRASTKACGVSVIRDSDPVSYTHLDVYKRQDTDLIGNFKHFMFFYEYFTYIKKI